MRALLLFTYVLALSLYIYDDQKKIIAEYVVDDGVPASMKDGYKGAKYYKLGTHQKELTVWIPFEAGVGGGSTAKHFLGTGIQMMKDYADNSGAPTFSFVLKMADWGGVVADTICNGTTECPDIICLGTTQIASRVTTGDMYPLNSFFQDYSIETGEIFPDNILQKYFYDYNYDGKWMGIPLVTDIRSFYYNRTTFNKLGLKHPPPYGDWGTNYKQTWTWAAMTNLAVQIKNAGYKSGFEFYGGWDEDLKLITLIARDYRLTMVDEDLHCALNTTSFRKMLDEVLRPLYTGSNPAANLNPNLIDKNTQAWIDAKTLPSPIGQPWSCCTDGPEFIHEGMRFYYPTITINKTLYAYDSIINPTGELAMAYMPGRATFLGGSGAGITAKSDKKALAWAYLKRITADKVSIYMNTDLAVLPPYYTAVDNNPEYKAPYYTVIKQAYSNAVPVQYPQGSFPQFGELEGSKPFRLLLNELMYKNLNNDQLADRLCTAINYIMQPVCTAAHMVIADSGCDPVTMERNLVYQWPAVKPCKNGIDLLKPIPLTCPYVPGTSNLAKALNAGAYVSIAITVLLMLGLFYFRNEMAVKKASFVLTSIVLLGSLIAAISVPLMSGDPAKRACGVEYWILGIGVSLSIGALAMKMWRLIKIFGAKTKLKLKLDDKWMMGYVSIILVIQLILCLVWYLVQRPGLVYTDMILPSTQIAYKNSMCGTTGSNISSIPMVINVLFVCYVVYLAVAGRNIPGEYNDGQLIGIIIYTIAFLLLVVLPANSFIADPIVQYTITSGGIIFGCLATSIIYASPKIYQAYMKIEIDSSMAASSKRTGKQTSQVSESSNGPVRCADCKKLIQ